MTLPRLGGASGRPLGYIPNWPDFRDYGLARQTRIRSATERAMSNGLYMPEVFDQGQQGACTAHTLAEDREYLHIKQLAALGEIAAPTPGGLYSPAFGYWIERQIDLGWTGGPFLPDPGDVGSSGRSSCQALRKYGCALRSDMPYTDSNFSTAPTDQQMIDALKWPTGQYHFLTGVQDIKDCIASGYNARFGFAVDEGFEGIGADGIWYLAGSVQGYHETLAYGYDDGVNGGSFLVRNSWGKDWGKAGDFYFSYAAAANKNVLSDACIQHLGIWSK